MRKKSMLLLIVVALLALGGTAFSVFAKNPGSDAKPQTKANALPGFAHTYFHIKPTFSPNGVPAGLSPTQFKKAYGLDQLTNDGTGITIAIIDAYGNPNAQADLNTYDTAFTLPATTISMVYPQGIPASVDEGWALETDLDIQMAHAVAPKAKIVLEAAKSPSNANLMAAVQDAYTKQGATLVSMSFGGSEFPGETGAGNDSIFAAGKKLGVSFTASSGDSGTGAQYPAASHFVTAVGGTTLKTQTDGSYVSETAWSGSGGGLSLYESRPAYQNGFQTRAKRGIPDVAMVADPNTGVSIYDSYGYKGKKGYFVVGGTSVAAPMFAGMLALAYQSHAGGYKNVDIELYSVAKTKYASDFHDVVSGSNGSCGAICTAHTGYDFVTGLGTPVAHLLVPDLIAAP